MEAKFVRKTGSAFVWKGVQLFGTKGIYTLRTLILSYILLPEHFGLFAITIIAIEMLNTVTDFGLIPALVHQNDPEPGQYHSAWSLNISRGFLISAIAFIFAPSIAGLFAQPEAAQYIRLIALKPLITNLASIKIAELTRLLKFRQLSYIKLSDAFVSTIVSIVLAPVINVWGLVAGILSGALISTILSYVYAPYKPKFSIYYAAVKPILHFSKWVYFSVLVSVAASNTLQVMITRELGLTELGLYFLAIHLAFLPVEIIKEVFGSVMFPVFAQIRYDQERLTIVYKAFLNIVLVLIVPVCVLMIFTAPYLVEYILSTKWSGTVGLIQIFSIVNLIGLFGETAVPLLTGLGKTKQVFVLDAVQSVLLLLLCFTFIQYWGINGAAAAWIPAIFISQMISLYYLVKILVNPFKGMTIVMLSVIFSSLLGAFIGYYVTVSYTGIIGFISGVTISGMLILTAMFLTDSYYKLGIRRNFVLAFPQIQSLGKFI